jgi:hypothetical protein
MAGWGKGLGSAPQIFAKPLTTGDSVREKSKQANLREKPKSIRLLNGKMPNSPRFARVILTSRWNLQQSWGHSEKLTIASEMFAIGSDSLINASKKLAIGSENQTIASNKGHYGH